MSSACAFVAASGGVQEGALCASTDNAVSDAKAATAAKRMRMDTELPAVDEKTR
jgi:hypothetical protein